MYQLLVFWAIFLAWMMLASLPHRGSARRAGQGSFWSSTTTAMLALPLAAMGLVYWLYGSDIITGPGFAIGLVAGGAIVFFAGLFFGGYYEPRIAVGARLLGWSMMLGPMLVSLMLSILLPLPMLLAFFVHHRWPASTSAEAPQSLTLPAIHR